MDPTMADRITRYEREQRFWYPNRSKKQRPHHDSRNANYHERTGHICGGNRDISQKRKHVCRACHFVCKRHPISYRITMPSRISVGYKRDTVICIGVVNRYYALDCPNCHIEGVMVNVGILARPPRKDASRGKWKAFWAKFENDNTTPIPRGYFKD